MGVITEDGKVNLSQIGLIRLFVQRLNAVLYYDVQTFPSFLPLALFYSCWVYCISVKQLHITLLPL